MAIDFVGAYADTEIELEVLKVREAELRRRVELAHKVVVSGKAPSSGREFCHVPLDKALKKLDDEAALLNEVVEAVERKEAQLRRMDELMQGLTGLPHKIAYMRYVKGLNMREIADILHHSHTYIRTVASRHKIAM